MRTLSLLTLAVTAAVAGCGLKDADPAHIYDGPAQPQVDPPLPDVGQLTSSPAIAGWRWVGLPRTVCRDGSSTGIAFQIPTGPDGRPRTDKLLVFMQGGGACLNAGCVESLNRSRFSEQAWNQKLCAHLDSCAVDGATTDVDARWRPRTPEAGPWFGVLDGDPANPFADWTKVYIPYCSGDWYAGLNATPIEIGAGSSRFLGSQNLQHSLAAMLALVGTDFDKVLVTGNSAGGIGALLNFQRFADVFGPERTYLISDAGPLYPDEHVAGCGSARIKNLWRMDRSFPVVDGCPGEDCPWNADSWISLRLRWLFDGYARGVAGAPHPGSRMALVVSDRDSYATASFFAFANDCRRLLSPALPTASQRAAAEAAVVAATDDLVADVFDHYEGVKAFVVHDTSVHQWMFGRAWWRETFIDRETGATVSLAAWVAAMLDEDPAWGHAHVRAPGAPTAADMVEAVREEGR